jgi:hypothetical protein
MPIQQLVLPYPDFKLQEVIDPEQFDLNNLNTTNKINIILTIINQLLEGVTDGTSGADQVSLAPIAPFTSTKLQAFLKEVVNRLRATTDGASGADLIASTLITGVAGNTVQAQLRGLKSIFDALQAQVTANLAALTAHKTSTDHDYRYYLKSEIDVKTTNLQSQITTNATSVAALVTRATNLETRATSLESRTTTNETNITNGYNLIVSHINNVANPHSTTAAQVGAYSKTEMQTSGQALLHWDNLTNKPNMADPKWKTPVANVGALPATGNGDGDIRIVLANETMYEWDGTTTAWVVVGALGNGITSHSSLTNLTNDDHVQYLRTDGGRALTGDLDFTKHQAKNFVVEQLAVAPVAPSTGQLWYDTSNNKLYIFKGAISGWVDVSARGSLIRDKVFTATAAQTVFDLSSVGTYEVGTNSVTVYKDGSLVPESFYTETSSTVITLLTGATAGSLYYFKWFENSPEVINTAVQRDGTLQVNLNSELLNGHPSSYYSTSVLTDILSGALASHTSSGTMHVPYSTDSGTANAKLLSISSPSTSAYVEGMAVSFKNAVLNTSSVTVNINALGAKALIKSNGTAITGGLLKANSIYTIRYNGSAFILQGEGGEYGTAIATQVLTGTTIGTDAGIVSGTMPNNGTINFTPSASAQTIPAGYTSGGTVAGVYVPATYVLSGTTIAGVAGTMPSYGSQSLSATNVAVDGGGGIYLNGPDGHYQVATSIAAWDGDFAPSNIRNGVSIFGVTGTLTPRLYASGSATASGTYSNVYFNAALSSSGLIPLSSIDGLGFTPMIVKLYSNTNAIVSVYMGNVHDIVETFMLLGSISSNGVSSFSAVKRSWSNTGVIDIRSGGFTLPINTSTSVSYTWEAWG